METGGLSPGDDGVAMDQAARMDELSRMLGESSAHGQHSMGLGQQGVAAGGGGPSNGDGGMGGGGGGVGEHNVKAEPALGAAALERVVAAAKAAHEEQQRSAEDQRAVCDLCNVRRADLRGPCGHKYHARCIYSMPITRCPYCDIDFGNDDGLFILPIEPYSAGMLFEEDDHRKGRDAEHQSRTGRWHSYETMYAQRIVADFDAGTMPLSEGTKLGNFLCNILNCSPSRLSKKLKIGKKYFQRCTDRTMGEEHVAKHREAQKRLSDLEEMFLMAESQTNRGVANTQILSECIQKEWRERFIGHAHTVNQKLKNAWDWNSSRRRAELSSDALNKLLSSITPGKTDVGANQLAPLFLVSHNNSGGGADGSNNNGGEGAAAGGGGGRDGGGSAGHAQGMQNVSLAQAMGNVLQSWQQGQHGLQRFPSAGGGQGGAAGGGAASASAFSGGGGGGASSSSHQAFPSAMVQRGPGQGSGEDFAGKPPSGFSWLEQQAAQGGQRHGQGHGGPGGPPEAMDDIEGFGDELWSSLETNLASLGYQNSVAIEDMEQDPLTNPNPNPTGQWAGAGGHGGPLGENPTGPPPALDDSPLFLGGVGGATSKSNPNGGPAVATLRDAGRGNGNRPAWQPSSGGNGGGGNMGGNGGPGGPGGAGGGGGGGGGPGGPGGGGGGPGGGGAGGGGGGGGGNDGGGGNGDDEDDEGSHRFEDFIGNFLDQIPFEAVDVWVPLCNQDQEGSEVVLFHAGYFTNVKELEEWGDYSTNFSFRQGQGLPGRVYGTNKSEWQCDPVVELEKLSMSVPMASSGKGVNIAAVAENVVSLNHSHFLRLNGARNIGIRTSFGVPVVSRWGVTFVIVFYSRAAVQLDPEMKAFIERTVSAWKFDATVDTDACQGDAAPATANPPGIRQP